jgi:hypothetical protein
MPLFNILAVVIITGIFLWVVNNYIPMDRKIKQVINIVVMVVVIVWLIRVFGIFHSLMNIQV